MSGLVLLDGIAVVGGASAPVTLVVDPRYYLAPAPDVRTIAGTAPVRAIKG
jgi:hypothetical protein